jgi:hypothetical protein
MTSFLSAHGNGRWKGSEATERKGGKKKNQGSRGEEEKHGEVRARREGKQKRGADARR